MTEDPLNILLVDDQPAKLLSYEAILVDLGEHLLKASSATEALQYLLKHDIAVILIDVCMPDLDGFELATMIRGHPRFQATAMIFVSAVAMTELDHVKGYEYGAVDYVPVPVVPELLRAKVRVFVELYRKTRQLKTLNGELERRVAERTAELEHMNSELERRVEERTREREVALAQVTQMQKLESLGQLTGGLAHDFNNLLMTILANLELLARRAPENPKAKHCIDSAIQAAKRGTNLTQRMLAFARHQELRPEVVNVHRLVESMTDMLQRSLQPTIEIRTDFKDSLVPIRVDRNQFELALLNLALNARDAMPRGGSLTIAACRESVKAGHLQSLEAGDYVCVAVKDTGTGMDEETLARAPEPFYTTKEVGKGTGLGLSMVFGLATQSGGGARITSRLGVGTTVELWLPIALSAEIVEVHPAGATTLPSTHSCRILVVDDDPLVGDATASMLEQLGHRPLVKSSGTEALNAIRSEPNIDLIITDQAMPGMTGLELTRHIRQIKPDLPLILATGYSEVLQHGVEPGMLCIKKPYSLDELAAMIGRLTGRAGIVLPEDSQGSVRRA